MRVNLRGCFVASVVAMAAFVHLGPLVALATFWLVLWLDTRFGGD